MTSRDERTCYLSTYDLHRLNHAIRAYSKIDRIGVYLVGSVLERPDWRDVDVRMILDDEDFDRLFASSELWETFCYAVSGALRADTGLPIDFQVQRMTEANERHPGAGRRNSLGGGRWFAGSWSSSVGTGQSGRPRPW